MKILRVFPRHTSFTPTDAYAFVGDPPMMRPEADEVHVSCAFTWDVERAKRLAAAWGQYYPVVKLGGPAFASPAEDFTPGMYLKDGVTFTSRGCNNRCPWCLVSEREGKLRLLNPISPGYIINDNNFLETGHAHMEKVFAMLRQQKHRAEFTGGLEPELVDDWFADQLRGLRVGQVFFACDTDAHIPILAKAAERLSFLGRDRLRCYVLLAYKGESIERGLARLKAVWDTGCIPFAPLYQPPEKRIDYSEEWRHLARMWSRPAETKALMKRQP